MRGCDTLSPIASFPIPIEDKLDRTPEWEPVERGYGNNDAALRSVEWDPTTNDVRVLPGPVVSEPKTKRERHIRPVP